jgi:enolase
MAKIKEIMAREILDSRGNPTIETRVTLDNGVSAKASVPSGASTGVHEAWELRDGDIKRYNGLGVLKAVKNVNTKIAEKLIAAEAGEQANIDNLLIKLDGTTNKKRLGANAILSVSLAVARASAESADQPLFEYLAKTFSFPINKYTLPIPSFNILNGGVHAHTNLDFQEFMVLPLGKISFADRVRMGAEIFHELGLVLRRSNLGTTVGDEGGYAPDISSSIKALEMIIAAGIKAGYKPGSDFGIGIDAGSSQFYHQEKKEYVFKLDQAHFTTANMIGLYNEWFRKYPVISIEDGLAEDDWQGWRELTRELGAEILLVGDDLFVTNVKRLRQGLKEKAANAVLIKLNQVGTLSETIDCIKLAQKHKYKIMISHRSGETMDDFIADLAVAVGAEYIKSGSLSRGERLAKYNRLMEIEDLLK